MLESLRALTTAPQVKRGNYAGTPEVEARCWVDGMASEPWWAVAATVAVAVAVAVAVRNH